MKKIYLSIFLFIIFSAPSIACDFQVINFGDRKEKLLEIFPGSLTFEDQFGGEQVIAAMDEVCKNEKKLGGTELEFLFMDNKLILITLLRGNTDDAALMDYAMFKYGSFKLPIGIEKKDWKGNHVWRVGNNIINYIKSDMHEGEIELLEVSSNLYSSQLNEYFGKVGIWLDSQN